ncbi:MAG TPA: hypothetical protein HPP66_04520 [Planctomycetes bacterium]|nr:hypothetical protein [Planctomycetota bacterium]
MTIKFNCPKCNALIAFDSKHAGKRARCQSCGQILIIPSKDDEKPKKIKTEFDTGEPIPGFYRAVFIESWKIFTTQNNTTPLVFVALVVCVKFFFGYLNFTLTIPGRSIDVELPMPLGTIWTIAAWGALFWYYMQIIYSTAFNTEELPQVYLGGFRKFMWNILKSVYTFIIILLVVELPYIIAAVITRKTGLNWPPLLNILKLGCLFFFPIAILTAAIGKDLTMLRPDYLLIPIFRALKPYLVVAALLITAGLLEMQTKQFNPSSKETLLTTTGNLFFNLALQVIAIIAMRAIGLFYRHYTCHLPW